MTGIHMESSRNSCCFPYISTFGRTYILHIPSKFNIMNIIIYIIHLKYSILPVLYCPPHSTWIPHGMGFILHGMEFLPHGIGVILHGLEFIPHGIGVILLRMGV